LAYSRATRAVKKTVREWTAQPSDLPQRGEDT
jgi:hypothetical protein